MTGFEDPKSSKLCTKPQYTVSNEGPSRRHLVVEIKTKNGEAYPGTVTVLEAKHEIFKESLGFELSNLFGAKSGWKWYPTIAYIDLNAIRGYH